VPALLGEGVFGHDVWLNTADHDHLRRVAESLAARVWGADRSCFLVNGSSSGNQAYLLAAVGPGDEVVVGRDLHKSLLVGLILTGARPVYVAPGVHPELGVGLGACCPCWPPSTPAAGSSRPTGSASSAGPWSWPKTPGAGCGCCPAWTCSAPTALAWRRAASTR
jgi:Orn/Lys/Arg decarboxylase, major domain